MIKLLSLFIISSLLLSNSWVQCVIENNLTIQFPSKPKFEKILTDYRMYSCMNKNCSFSVDNDRYPKPVYPESKAGQAKLFEQSINNFKAMGLYINSQRFVLGKINGIEIKSYFITPDKGNKLIQVERSFFINYRIYRIRCLYNNKIESVCEKDCKTFFSSLKFND